MPEIPAEMTRFVLDNFGPLAALVGVLATAAVTYSNGKRAFNHTETLNKLDKVIRRLDGVESDNAIFKRNSLKRTRFELYKEITRCLKKDCVTLDEFREITHLFDTYKELGGNGEIEVLYEKLKDKDFD